VAADLARNQAGIQEVQNHMRTPSVEVLRAFAELQGNHMFERIMTFVRESHDLTVEQLQTETDPTRVFRLQGSSVVLQDIKNLHEKARDELEKISNTR